MVFENEENSFTGDELLLPDWVKDYPKHLKEFQDVFEALREECPTDDDCREVLFKSLTNDDPAKCKKCGCADFERKYGSLKGKCKKCRLKKHFLADYEFFRGLKRPRLYLLLYRIFEKGLICNRSQLAEASDVWYASAWNLATKVGMALSNAISDDPNTKEEDSSKFAALIRKRSSLTPVKKKPIAEQEDLETAAAEAAAASSPQNNQDAKSDEASDATKQKNTEEKAEAKHREEQKDSEGEDEEEEGKEDALLKGLSQTESETYILIGSDPISVEELFEGQTCDISKLLSALAVLELKGLIIPLAGDNFIRNRTKQPASKIILTERKQTVSALITESIIQFLQVTYKGISQKYLQVFVADFCRVLAHRLGKTFFSAAEILLEADETGHHEVMAFSTALRVKVLV